MGLANFALGHYEEAIGFATAALAERPGLTWPFRDIAVYRAWLGDDAGARDALAKFTYLRPAMTLESVADSLRFMEPGLHGRYVEGLRRAGLPSASAVASADELLAALLNT
jgi:hypothetical protein